MKIICAWCRKNMGEKPPFGGLNGKLDKAITHGICSECEESILGKSPKTRLQNQNLRGVKPLWILRD